MRQLAFPVQMAGLFFELDGSAAAAPVIGVSSAAIGFGVLCLALNVWRHTRA